jgi:hypothetical protein
MSKQPKFSKPLSPWEQIALNSAHRCKLARSRAQSLNDKKALRTKPSQVIVVVNPLKKEQND